jgi:hypothetical protein
VLLFKHAIYSHNSIHFEFEETEVTDETISIDDKIIKVTFTEIILKKSMDKMLKRKNIFVQMPTNDGFDFYIRYGTFVYSRKPLQNLGHIHLIDEDEPKLTNMQRLCEYISENFYKNEKDKLINLINNISEYTTINGMQGVVIPASFMDFSNGLGYKYIAVVALACNYDIVTLSYTNLKVVFSSYTLSPESPEMISIKYRFRKSYDVLNNVIVQSKTELKNIKISLVFTYNDFSIKTVVCEVEIIKSGDLWEYKLINTDDIVLIYYNLGVELKIDFMNETNTHNIAKIMKELNVYGDLIDYNIDVRRQLSLTGKIDDSFKK